MKNKVQKNVTIVLNHLYVLRTEIVYSMKYAERYINVRVHFYTSRDILRERQAKDINQIINMSEFNTKNKLK